MPYIAANNREFLDMWLDDFKAKQDLKGLSPGELNFIITTLLLRTRPVSYLDFNTLIGVLESVKLEFYRRAVAPYEDVRRAENGDVF